MKNYIVEERIEINEANKQIKYNGYSRSDILSHKLKETNCYDYVAGVQRVVDISQIHISREKVDKIIKEFFICQICHEVYTNIVQLKSCLHSYCKKCFDDCVKTKNKKCIFCRVPVETRRSAFINPTLNELLSLFIPDKDKYIQNEEAEYELNKDKYTFNNNIAKTEIKHISAAIDDNSNSQSKDKELERNQSSINMPKANGNVELSSDKNINCLGQKRVLITNEDDKETTNASFGLGVGGDKDLNLTSNGKRPKYDIVKKKTPLMQVVNEYKNDNYAIIQIAPYNNNSNEVNLFQGLVKSLVMHQRTSLREIAIYISDRLKFDVLPGKMYFIVRENEFNRTLTNLEVNIKSIIECYTHNKHQEVNRTGNILLINKSIE